MANRRWHSDTLYNITVKLSVEYYKYVKINTYGIIYNILITKQCNFFKFNIYKIYYNTYYKMI